MTPVNVRNTQNRVPKHTICTSCNAPAQYLYYNDGKKRSQIKCKICGSLSQVNLRYRKETKYWCPHCTHALYLWKEQKDVSIYNRGCKLARKTSHLHLHLYYRKGCAT